MLLRWQFSHLKEARKLIKQGEIWVKGIALTKKYKSVILEDELI